MTRRLLWYGQSLDAFSFLVAITLVPPLIMAEANPFTAGLYAIGGIGAVVGAKLGLTAFVLWRDTLRQGRPRLTGAVMLLAAATGFVGALANTYALGLVWRALG